MIGMSQIKKKTIQGILIGASVGIVVAVGVSVFSFFTILHFKSNYKLLCKLLYIFYFQRSRIAHH